MTNMRRAELGRLLEDRRRQVQLEVQSRMRDGRTGRTAQVGDIGEISEAGTQEDIDFALLQSKAEALGRLDEAIGRIEAGEYGDCLVCHVENLGAASAGAALCRSLHQVRVAARAGQGARSASRGVAGRFVRPGPRGWLLNPLKF